MKSPASPKETVYIDVDDEITAVIDKVRGSSGKIVALVLPKRASVFQSIVNMKLLQRVAKDDHKHIVLITSEQSVLPLAGSVGLHVAHTLQSKPYVPEQPARFDAPLTVSEDIADEDLADPVIDRTAPIGSVAGVDPEPIEIEDDTPVEPQAPQVSKKRTQKKPKSKLKVPDFNSYRTRVIIGVSVLVVGVIGWIVAFMVLPTARITLKTDTVSVTSTLTLSSSPSIKTLDQAKRALPGTLQEYKKTDTQKVAATGKKDVGTKASGSATFTTQTNCVSQVPEVPAGTTISSANLNFVTAEAATLNPSGFQNGKCVFTSSATDVSAANAGDQYNLSPRSYAVAGFEGISASGSAMSGGTSKVLTIVSQEDIDGVKQKIVESSNAGAAQDMAKRLKDSGYYALTETISNGEALVTASPNVGSEASEVTVNVTVSYTMAGVKEADLKTILESDIKKQIDTTKQNILDNGLSKAILRISDKKPSGDVQFTLQSVAAAGVQQNEDEIKKAIAGKKRGEVQSLLQSRPGIKEVIVDYKPFWVYKTPSSTNKITIVFEQSSGTINGR